MRVRGRIGAIAVVAAGVLALAARTRTLAGSTDAAAPAVALPFQNPDLPFEARVADLVSRLTVEEKISQMMHDAPGDRAARGPAYNWWNECLHGVARAGVATVFPQAIGLAAVVRRRRSWREVATAIADEARAKHHEFVRHGQRGIYQGLTFWSPNINIFRDPRWGRGQETYGEDPYLTGTPGRRVREGAAGRRPEVPARSSPPRSTSPCTAAPSPSATASTPASSDRDLCETYLPRSARWSRRPGWRR